MTETDNGLSPQESLIWCMRLWAVSRRLPIAAGEKIAAILGRLGAADAPRPFEAFMRALHRGAARPLGLNCIRRPLVSGDERALLDGLALIQHGRRFEALLQLRELVAPHAGQPVLDEAEKLAGALSRAGCYLDPPEGSQRFILGATLHEAGLMRAQV